MQADETIFDLYDPEGREERLADTTKYSGLMPQIAAGVAQGAGDIGGVIGMAQGAIQAPLTYGLLNQDERKETATSGQRTEAELITGDELSDIQKVALMSDDDLMPGISLPGARSQAVEAVEDIGPGGAAQEAVRRVTRSVVGSVAGPGVFLEMAVRDLVGMGGKEIAKKMGMGETAQAVFDLGFSVAPNPKKFIEGGSRIIQQAEKGAFTTQEQMIQVARDLGMSETEIAPLVREGWFNNVLKKVAKRGGKTERAIHQTSGALSRGWDVVKEGEAASQAISPQARQQLVRALEKNVSGLTGQAHEAIKKSLSDLYNGPITGRKMINFWSNLNELYPEYKALQGMKGPITDAMRTLDPKLSKQFTTLNTLSNRFRSNLKKFEPGEARKIAEAALMLGETGAMFQGLLSGHLPVVAGALGTMGTRSLAEMMLTNPRFINLHKKMVTTLNGGQIKAGKQVLDSMIEMIAKESPDTAAALRQMSDEDFEAFFSSTKD